MKADFVEGGFKFRYIDGDYDFAVHKSAKYKKTKKNMRRAKWYKTNFEYGYSYWDYDCSGSTKVRIEIKVGKDYILVYRYWSKDV